MKVTIEVDVESLNELQSVVGSSRIPYGCQSRLRLIRDIYNFAKECVNRGCSPTLTESKNVVWNHVFPLDGSDS